MGMIKIHPMRMLFLQLPMLDNDTSGAHENLGMAGGLLGQALELSDMPTAIVPVQEELNTWDDAHIHAFIIAEQPDLIAATLYAWNVERTLSILHDVRKQLPNVRILVGGPEVSADNPILRANPIPDALTTGEGEPVIAALVNAIENNKQAPFSNTASLQNGIYQWGSHPPPHCIWPPSPQDAPPLCGPDRNGMAYIEATRGCPFRCSYCCYSQRRKHMAHSDIKHIVRTIARLRDQGAREIRFVDPTLNSHPAFDELLKGLAGLNKKNDLILFGELHPERITAPQANALARAGFREIEVGVQSRDPAVLKAVQRPTNQDNLDRGIQHLAAAGIKLTVDVMGGLPYQTLKDIQQSLDWAAQIRGADIQFMHTLLLPNTELRQRWSHALRALKRPPYRVTRTDWLSAAQFKQADILADQVCGGRGDSPTHRFVGCRLPDLFKEQICMNLTGPPPPFAGKTNRRALIICGNDLFGQRNRIATILRQAVRKEPHILWQFVMRPRYEEPLDLLDFLIGELRRFPRHTLDNMIAPEHRGQRAARRIFLKPYTGQHYDPTWIDAAEQLLSRAFY